MLAKDIGVSPEGEVWIISTRKESEDYAIYKLIGKNGIWKKISGRGSRIAVDHQGNPWVLKQNGLIF